MTQCTHCEYQSVCFVLLKVWISVSKSKCQQGRRQRTTRCSPIISPDIIDLGVGGYTDVITNDDPDTAINKFGRDDL